MLDWRDRLIPLLYLLAGCALLYAILWGAEELSLRLQFELSGPTTPDAHVQWAHGRTIAEGGRPYIDTFDFKPLGMAYTVAASLWLTGGYELCFQLQVLVLLVVAFAPLAAAAAAGRGRMERAPFLLLLGAALQFGIALSLLTAKLGGTFRVESFSVSFAALFAVLLSGRIPESRKLRTLTLALLLFLACAFRETAAASAAAAALLLSESFADFCRLYIVPLVIALASGAASLVLMGVWPQFWEMYVEQMAALLFSGAGGAQSDLFASLGAPVSYVRVLYHDLRNESYILAAWTAGLAAAGLYASAAQGGPAGARLLRIFRYALGFLAGYLAVFGGIITIAKHRSMVIPLYVALFAVTARWTVMRWPSPAAKLILGAVVLCAAALRIEQPVDDYRASLAKHWKNIREARFAAAQVDGALDACGAAQYVYVGGLVQRPMLPAFTEHRPEGPLFFQQRHFLDGTLPKLQMLFYAQLEKSHIIALDHTTYNRRYLADGYEPLKRRIDRRFRKHAWPCAEPYADALKGTEFELRFARYPHRPADS